MKTHRITTSKTHGQRTQEWTQGIPLRGLGATWTCEAGGSLYRGGICWQLAASRLLESFDPWLRPMQLSPITSSQQALGDAIPLRGPAQDIPADYSLIGIKSYLPFPGVDFWFLDVTQYVTLDTLKSKRLAKYSTL